MVLLFAVNLKRIGEFHFLLNMFVVDLYELYI